MILLRWIRTCILAGIERSPRSRGVLRGGFCRRPAVLQVMRCHGTAPSDRKGSQRIAVRGACHRTIPRARFWCRGGRKGGRGGWHPRCHRRRARFRPARRGAAACGHLSSAASASRPLCATSSSTTIPFRSARARSAVGGQVGCVDLEVEADYPTLYQTSQTVWPNSAHGMILASITSTSEAHINARFGPEQTGCMRVVTRGPARCVW